MTKKIYQIICVAILILFSSLAWSQNLPSQIEAAENSDINTTDDANTEDDSTSSEEDISNDGSEEQAAEATNSNTLKTIDFLNKAKNKITDNVIGKKIVSLMYNDEENGDIERAIESLKSNQVFVPTKDVTEKTDDKNKAEEENIDNAKSYIYLASIIYFNARDWVVWIGDQKITSKTNQQNAEIYLTSVTRDQVSAIWALNISKWKILSHHSSDSDLPPMNENNKVEIKFTLKPNQTFILASNNVAEGNSANNIKKQTETTDSNKATSKQKNLSTPSPKQRGFKN